MPTCPSPRRRRKDGELATLRAELAAVTLRPARCTVHRAPCTLYPAPYTLHPIPWQVHAARLEDAGALSAAVQQQQLQANASAPPAPPAPDSGAAPARSQSFGRRGARAALGAASLLSRSVSRKASNNATSETTT